MSNDREIKKGGGVGVFLRQGFELKNRCDLEVPDTNGAESVFIEILQPCNNKNIIVGCVYKPPDTSTEFFN